jgi:hypothetical protein
VLVSHRDDLTVLGRDDVKLSDALDERGTLGRGGFRAIIRQRKHGNRLARRGEDVDPLVTILERQVDHRVPGNAAATCEVEPDHPVGVAGAWRALGAVRDAMGAPAAVAPVIGEAMPRVIWRSLLRTRTRIICIRLGLLPPAETGEVQGIQFLKELPLYLGRPGLEPFGEVGGVHGSLPRRNQAARCCSGSRRVIPRAICSPRRLVAFSALATSRRR